MTTAQHSLVSMIKHFFMVVLIIFVLLILLGVPRFFRAPAATLSAVQSAATTEASDDVLLRFGGDATVPPGEALGVVVVVEGDAMIRGTVDVAILANGTMRVQDGQVGQLVVIDGHADLQQGAVVSGDVRLIDATLTQDPASTIQGSIERGIPPAVGGGIVALGIMASLGWVLVVLLSGVALAALAGPGVRHVGYLIVGETKETLLATLVFWVGVPLAAVLAMITIVGLPAGLAVFIFVLPAAAFAGYMIAGIRLGDTLLEWIRGSAEAYHPYLAALVGIATLMIAGTLPVIGELISAVATFVGSGALALHLWRRARTRSSERRPALSSRRPVAA